MNMENCLGVPRLKLFWAVICHRRNNCLIRMPRALQSLTAATQTSARFYIPEEKRYLSALLDYIMVSPDLRAKRRQWRIWHPFEDAACYADLDLRTALLVASDHFPVVVDLDF